MSWPTFTALSSAWWFALAAPLVALYFLKLRRPLMLVPSTALWQRVLDDQRVNSPFQRFKRHLLLWLQLLLLLLLVLAAMQPVMQSPEASLDRRPVFVDNSASMAALDGPGGRSRLAEAKEKVGRLIDDLLPHQQLSIVSFAGRARSRCGFTGNKRLLRDALASIAVDEVPSNLDDAMRVARALSRGASFDEALLVTDGNLPVETHTELSFELRVVPVGPAGENIGITGASARRADDGDWLVFVELAGTNEELSATLTIAAEGEDEPIGSERIALSGAEDGAGSEADEGVGLRARRLFRVDGEAAGPLTLTLTPDGFDALAADDVAFVDLPKPRPLRVFVAPNLSAYRVALSALPDLHVDPDPGAGEGAGSDATAEGRYDLVLTDRPQDIEVETGVLLTLGLLPAALDGLVDLTAGGDEAQTGVEDWNRSEEALLHVGLSDVVVLADPAWVGAAREAALERVGFEVLVYGGSGPLMVRKGGESRFHLLFHTDRSTLPYRIGFPVFVANLVSIARRAAGLAEVRGAQTGVLPAVSLDAGSVGGEAVQIDGPGGSVTAKVATSGALTGVAARRVGRYRIRQGGAELAAVGVALLSAAETQLRRVEKIAFKESLAVEVGEGELQTDRELWQWLALLGLLVLCTEWWFFNLMGKRRR